MQEILGFRFGSSETLTPRIYESNGGKSWKVYAPGSSYTQVDRKTLRGAARLARKLWGNVDVRVIYLNGNTVLI